MKLPGGKAFQAKANSLCASQGAPAVFEKEPGGGSDGLAGERENGSQGLLVSCLGCGKPCRSFWGLCSEWEGKPYGRLGGEEGQTPT